ncbi:MAG: phosphoglucosamine mutase [Acidimicrobiia bacterium]|nr:phosphoglucosamine mutase [Acidimicrobiia bacterium]
MLKFGTDGVRGVANVELTPELVLALGRAAARVLAQPDAPFLIGRDTRLSGPMLEGALAGGLASEGVDVTLLGVLPTPGVAWRAAADDVPAAVISASHNPYADNGIKFFAAGGRKLPDATEAQLEAELDRILAAAAGPAAQPQRTTTGRIAAAHSTPATGNRDDPYANALVATIEGRTLHGLHVVVDCANGAASRLAPDLLRRLGARVDVLADDPDGTNINDGCGSTHPEHLQKTVVERGADAGLALDGDADRVLAVDHKGQLVDGDQIIAACALDLRERGLLQDDTVVVTVMTNLGFRHAMEAHGVHVVETAVGDRYVLEALEENGLSLGGEQSGHVIFRSLATTGDGLLTGIQLLDLMARSGRTLADLASVMTRLPQVLKNVRVADREGLAGSAGEAFWADVRTAESTLAGAGRVLVRPSGTEPVVRVMVEAPTAEQAQRMADHLCASLAAALGPPTS